MGAVSVGDVLKIEDIKRDFRLVAGGPEALERRIEGPQVQRVGVALTGYHQHLVAHRVQLIGRSESGYLETISAEERERLLEPLFEVGFPALVVTAERRLQPELIEAANRHHCALIQTSLESIVATERLNRQLNRWLTVKETRHAVLVDVHGVGVMLVGKSGIGKSEVGLELISRGHRLVADDIVILEKASETAVVGHSAELTRYHMEIRGLGIINIQELFGVSAVRNRKRVELVVELVEWSDDAAYDRLGIDIKKMKVADVAVDHLSLPVRPGRSLSLVIEVAARNRLLQQRGTHSAAEFVRRIDANLSPPEDPLLDLSMPGADDENE